MVAADQLLSAWITSTSHSDFQLAATSAGYIAYRHIGNCGSTEFQKP